MGHFSITRRPLLDQEAAERRSVHLALAQVTSAACLLGCASVLMTVPAWHTLNTLHSQPLPFTVSLRKGLEDSHGPGSQSTRAYVVHRGFLDTLCFQQSMLRQSGPRSHHLFMGAIWLLRDWEELNASKRTLFLFRKCIQLLSGRLLPHRHSCFYLVLKCAAEKKVERWLCFHLRGMRLSRSVSDARRSWGWGTHNDTLLSHRDFLHWLILLFLLLFNTCDRPPPRLFTIVCFIMKFTVLQMEKWCWSLINDHLRWSNEWCLSWDV